MPISTTMKTTTVNVQLPPEIKEQAESVFAYHGLTLPEAIVVFIYHTCQAGDIPFDINSSYLNSPQSLAALEESQLMEENPGAYKSYNNAEELIADCLLGDDDDD